MSDDNKLLGFGEYYGANGPMAPDFTLKDQLDSEVNLTNELSKSQVLLVFYPKDFGLICSKQLCNYGKAIADFRELNLNIIGISSNNVNSHQEFSAQYKIPFPLLEDKHNLVSMMYGCRSKWLLGGLTRAVFFIGRNGNIIFKYVEPTQLTHRSSSELLQIGKVLKKKKIIF